MLVSRSRRRAAFPRWSATERRWKKCFISTASSFPRRLAECRPSFFRSLTASASQPPKVSTTRGLKAMPWARQFSKWARFFEALRISMAAAGESAARWMMASCVGETTLTSKANFPPSIQFSMNTSAGRSDIERKRKGNNENSFVRDWQIRNKVSRRGLGKLRRGARKQGERFSTGNVHLLIFVYFRKSELVQRSLKRTVSLISEDGGYPFTHR